MKKRVGSVVLTLMLAFAFLGMPLTAAPGNVQASSDTEKYQDQDLVSIGGIAERIDYTTEVIDTKLISPATPSTYYSGLSCGITAGGITVAYNDIWLPNLIPGFTPASLSWGIWMWYTTTPAVTTMYNTLYVLMGANSAGVTVAGYKDGLASYTDIHGYNITYTDVRAGNNSLTSGFKTAINNGKLVSLFFNTFNITGSSGVTHSAGYDEVALTLYGAPHVMVAYGYMEIQYKNAQGNVFRTDFYAAVQTGFQSNSWVRINDYCTLDAAWVTDIH